jgi:hypothetical protein
MNSPDKPESEEYITEVLDIAVSCLCICISFSTPRWIKLAPAISRSLLKIVGYLLEYENVLFQFKNPR